MVRKKYPEKALTAVKVRGLKDPGMYADGGCLYLVVDESGAKRWNLRVTVHGKRRDIGLGGVTWVSLAEAREEAARLRKIARMGGDPLTERRRERQTAPTFEEAARKVHEAHSATFRNAKHAAQWISTLETYAFPVFGKRTVDKIQSSDVLMALSPIWTAKPETARRVKQRIKTVFAWCKVNGYCAANPAEDVKEALPKHTGKKQHFAALPWVQVPAFLSDLRESRASLSARIAFEFLILTAARTGEVIHATWQEIDLAAGVWTVPAERMKAKVEHRVPLSARCLELLACTKEMESGKYVFPGRTRSRPLSNMTFEMVLRRMERRDVTAHGFRSSFRDWAEEKTAFKGSVVEAALAHSIKNKVEAAYRRGDLFDLRRRLMDAWAAFATTTRGKVVKMREA